VYVGDGEFNPDQVDAKALAPYRTVLLPEARDLGEVPAAALREFAQGGGTVVTFSESPLDPAFARRADGDRLTEAWRRFREDDRAAVVEDAGLPASSIIESSERGVGIVRSIQEGRQVFHLLSYRYDETTDTVAPVKDLALRIPWAGSAASCTLRSLAGELRLISRIENGTLHVEVPLVDPYAVLVVV
jgi:hypothetical protein